MQRHRQHGDVHDPASLLEHVRWDRMHRLELEALAHHVGWAQGAARGTGILVVGLGVGWGWGGRGGSDGGERGGAVQKWGGCTS
jgi:hypothetical protein